MYNRISYILLFFILGISVLPTAAQNNTLPVKEKPTILYSGTPKEYEIGGIEVSGIKNYEDYVLIGLSGLAVGQKITVPGAEITQAVKRYWKHGLFSNVRIEANKIVGEKIFLSIFLTQRPRISEIHYNGVKKSEKEDLQMKLGLVKGNQITPNLIDRAELLIKKHFDEKGFKNATVNIVQRDDVSGDNQVIVDINVDKKTKIKVHQIFITGNKVLKTNKIKRTMKKTNEKNKLRNIFRTKKFIAEKYEEDKQLIIDKYNELGYRDARIVSDSVINYNDKSVNVYLHLEEGDKYHIRNIKWIGNTLYPSEQLDYILRLKKGDIYNQKLLNQRLSSDDDAIGNLYYNNGYVFYRLDPVETQLENDSVDLEMRIVEGPKATIDQVKITGNTRLYEDVVRRELRTKPGDLFSREALERSYREIAQMGHFNPETIKPDVKPNPENGTVDINYILESKSNDQVELSAGWGQTGVIGKVSLKFTNFSFNNLFRKNKNFRGFIPQGDGQTLTLSGQTNGKYYQSYSVSFFDPWFGGKRPNSFSVSAFFSYQTDVSSQYYNRAYYDNMYNSYGYGGYGNGYGSYNNASNYYDPDKSVKLYGLSIGWGKRLSWPDDYFTLSTELSYQRYVLKNWRYFPVDNGSCNMISLGFTLGRNSTSNPIYPRSGSEFSASVEFTPPYSLFDGKDYSKYDANKQSDVNEMNKWIEFHKWKFKSKTYTAFTSGSKCPVLMTRAEFGFVGYYNKHKRSPFETFYVGGDGMTGYSSSYATETIALRGYENGSLTPYGGGEGYAYSRLGLELRYPLMLETSTSIYALAFVEAGNAWNRVSKFNPFDMKRSAGVGVRIFLPMVGMMGIDWAYGFDTVWGNKSNGGSRFHFILGQEF